MEALPALARLLGSIFRDPVMALSVFAVIGAIFFVLHLLLKDKAPPPGVQDAAAEVQAENPTAKP